MPFVSESTRGRLYVVAAALLWSTNGLFVKSPLFADWPQEQRGLLLAMWRGLFAALCLLPLVRAPRWSRSLIVPSVAFFLMAISFLQSMVWTTAANAIWLQNIAPAWICLFARLSGERIDRRDLTMLLFAAGGIGLILTCELTHSEAGPRALWGVVLGATSGLLYAVVIYYLRKLREFDSAWLVVVNLSTTAIVLCPLPGVIGIWPHGLQWPALVAFGGLQLGLAYFCFARGLQTISSQEGVVIGLLEPILVPIWVWLRYGELPAWWTVAGGGLILVGLVRRYLPRTISTEQCA